MRFTLTYTGPLHSNGGPEQKHILRKAFHSQLKVLWSYKPLSDHTAWFNPGNAGVLKINLNRKVGPYRFVPLVNSSLFLICELHIFLLKPEEAGSIVTQAGDIDNRLKTLFDALRVPKNEGELPKDSKPEKDEDPFFCLLEDDALITNIAVETERLLESDVRANQVHLDIQVNTRSTRILENGVFLGNIAL